MGSGRSKQHKSALPTLRWLPRCNWNTTVAAAPAAAAPCLPPGQLLPAWQAGARGLRHEQWALQPSDRLLQILLICSRCC